MLNLHVKDFAVRRPDHKMGFTVEGRPAGQGRLDVPWLLGALRDVGRAPNAIVELWTPPQDTLAATVALEDGWARSSVEYLRGLVPEGNQDRGAMESRLSRAASLGSLS